MSSSNNDDDNDAGTSSCFQVDALVQVFGLKSEAGQKLNGGHGIIMAPKKKKQKAGNDNDNDNDGPKRYPVLLYALQQEQDQTMKLLGATMSKSVKGENLQLLDFELNENTAVSDLYENAVRNQLVFSQQRRDMDQIDFWFQHYYKTKPDDFRMAGNYAKWLRERRHKPKEAYEILQTLTCHFDPQDDEYYPIMCSDYCITAAMAHGDLEEALEYAHKISVVPENGNNKQLAFQSYIALLQTAETILHESLDPQTLDTSKLCRVHTACAKRIWELEPDKVDHLHNLGASYCMAGNHLQGAKWYRRALAKNGGTMASRTKQSLIIAQLQCPGMPLEDYFIMCTTPDGTHVRCAHNNDKHKFHLQMKQAPNGVVGTILPKNEQIDVLFHPLPTDPNDADVFPPELLQQLTGEHDM
ncbi:expressed unknown protein [Seminavis robusta]|uniref:Uncharacterized protein n=1 Tax=Seminavis robusta TaxID=568900 RepID=A0A9N8DGR4_9STRA|nr:expressed unknown protein [Seminavis robusta]|eukprot:Sro118_g057640.1 n/a (413) ;mRNA; f:21170-22408